MGRPQYYQAVKSLFHLLGALLLLVSSVAAQVRVVIDREPSVAIKNIAGSLISTACFPNGPLALPAACGASVTAARAIINVSDTSSNGVSSVTIAESGNDSSGANNVNTTQGCAVPTTGTHSLLAYLGPAKQGGLLSIGIESPWLLGGGFQRIAVDVSDDGSKEIELFVNGTSNP